MARDSFTKGYQGTKPEDAKAGEKMPYGGPGNMAEAYKERWKGVPEPYPFGKEDEGGGE